MRKLRFLLHLFTLVLFGSIGFAQQRGPLVCQPSAVPAIVRSEGLAEQLGDILLNCTGGYPSDTLSMNLGVFLVQTNLTNRLDSAGNADLVVTADNGSGPVRVGASTTLQGTTGVIINGLQFQLSAQGTTNIRIQNIRGAAAQVGGVGFLPAITAYLSFSTGTPGSIAISNNPLVLGTPRPGLFASQIPTAVACQNGAPLPDGLSFRYFLQNGARFFSTRVTEGFVDAFRVKGPFDDSGTRFIIRYTGLPSGSRVVVPNAIAGSDTNQPTQAGDFGGSPTGGIYQPSSGGTLLLARVLGADASGAGGSPAYAPGAPGSDAVAFDVLSDVSLDSNGNGYAVYEVVDANNLKFESAQIPTFVGVPRLPVTQTISVGAPVSFAPVSTVNVAAANVPEPRFVAAAPASDCGVIGDCNANYLPKLTVTSEPLNFTVPQKAAPFARYIQINNAGGGLLTYSITATYSDPTQPFLILYPASTIGNSTLRVDFNPVGLNVGTYRATITIDAGAAGVTSIPVQLTVVAGAPPVITVSPTVFSVGNAAVAQVTSLVPGSLGSIFGKNFGGNTVKAMFDNVPATITFANESQINVRVPAELAGKSNAQLIVDVDGNKSASQTVQLASYAPAIFANGVLNQDNSVNRAGSPAAPGSVIQVFATGLMPPAGGQITVQLNGQPLRDLYYAGQAPTVPGVQQVDFFLPSELQSTTVDVQVCGQPTAGDTTPACSTAVKVNIGQ